MPLDISVASGNRSVQQSPVACRPRHLHALAEKNIRSTQLRYDLIHRMSFLTHLKESFPGLRPHWILSLTLVHFLGEEARL